MKRLEGGDILNKIILCSKSFHYPDYQMYDHRMGMKVDFETEKSLIGTLSPFLTMGPWKILYENEDVYAARQFSKYREK